MRCDAPPVFICVCAGFVRKLPASGSSWCSMDLVIHFFGGLKLLSVRFRKKMPRVMRCVRRFVKPFICLIYLFIALGPNNPWLSRSRERVLLPFFDLPNLRGLAEIPYVLGSP